MSKIALITGITGQDGSYLAELLLEKNYNVFGLVRPSFSISNTKKTWRLKNCLKDIKLYKKSLFDEDSIKALVRKVKPDEIYHLAAQAYDGYSFRNQLHQQNLPLMQGVYCFHRGTNPKLHLLPACNQTHLIFLSKV